MTETQKQALINLRDQKLAELNQLITNATTIAKQFEEQTNAVSAAIDGLNEAIGEEN